MHLELGMLAEATIAEAKSLSAPGRPGKQGFCVLLYLQANLHPCASVAVRRDSMLFPCMDPINHILEAGGPLPR